MSRLTLQVLRVLGVDEVGQVTAVVEDHVQRLVVLERRESLLDAPVVLILGFALPSKDGNTSGSDAERRMSFSPSRRVRNDIRSSSVILG